MTKAPLTPYEFSMLTDDEKRNSAYSELWDAWQDKGKRKTILQGQRNRYRSVFQAGADGANARYNVVSEKIIEEFWRLKQSDQKTSAGILHDYQKRRFTNGALAKGTVKNWNTALLAAWNQQDWEDTPEELTEFKNRVRNFR